jgi:quinohemoprotein ethanol dehydrogenase
MLACLFACVLVACLLVACTNGPGAGASSAPPAVEGDWLFNGRSADGQRYSPLRQIDVGNVQRLGLAWEFRDFVVRGRTHRGMQSNPLMVDGILYFSSPWGYAYAVDARTGKLRWQFDPQPDGQYGRSACCDVINRGVAFWQGQLYVASLDGYLHALDAQSGKLLWRADTFVDRHWNYTITGAPLIAGDNVLIGNAGADMGARGYVSAYNLKTGALAWRFWSVPGDPKKGPDESPDVTRARSTWAADTHWELGGGGAVWDSMLFDPVTDLVYLGTGNGNPQPVWLRSPGGGDNLYVASIVAVEANTGRIKWYYQQTPGDSWDFDAAVPMVLADIDVEGKRRQVLMQASKNGFFYVLDRVTGALLRADAYTALNWADGIDLKTGRPRIRPTADFSGEPTIVAPGPPGGHGWHPIAFNPDTGLVYLSAQEAPMRMWADTSARFQPGFMNQGTHGSVTQPFMAILKAWNPLTGKAAWQTGPMAMGIGGTLATAGGLVFQGSPSGELFAYDARSGKVLLQLDTGTAISAAPITYTIDGVQYVAVMAGAGGPMGAFYGPEVVASRLQNFERLLVFKLDGTATPRPPAVTLPPRQPMPPALPASVGTIAHGKSLFADHCARCHVPGGAYGAYPDLWNMPAATLAVFEAIVHGGALRAVGMGDFADVLSVTDVAAIKAYIVTDQRARQSAGQAPAGH